MTSDSEDPMDNYPIEEEDLTARKPEPDTEMLERAMRYLSGKARYWTMEEWAQSHVDFANQETARLQEYIALLKEHRIWNEEEIDRLYAGLEEADTRLSADEKMLAEARKAGAEEMRERCAKIADCEDDVIAAAIRKLPTEEKP